MRSAVTGLAAANGDDDDGVNLLGGVYNVNRPLTLVIFARNGLRVMGCVVVRLHASASFRGDQFGEVLVMAVPPDARGLGIGRALRLCRSPREWQSQAL